MQTLEIGNEMSFYNSCESMPIVEPSAKLNQAQFPLRCAYGKCSHWGCGCVRFEGDTGSSVCNNCGHSYSDHWS